jgi:hypothetical protein
LLFFLFLSFFNDAASTLLITSIKRDMTGWTAEDWEGRDYSLDGLKEPRDSQLKIVSTTVKIQTGHLQDATFRAVDDDRTRPVEQQPWAVHSDARGAHSERHCTESSSFPSEQWKTRSKVRGVRSLLCRFLNTAMRNAQFTGLVRINMHQGAGGGAGDDDSKKHTRRQTRVEGLQTAGTPTENI